MATFDPAFFYAYINFLPMRFNLLIASMLFFSACAEHDSQTPCYTPSWEGNWRRLNVFGEDWLYGFEGQIMRQSLTKFGATIVELEAPYNTSNDTLWVGDNINTPLRRWKFEWIGDSVVQVIDIPPGGVLNERFWMRKQAQ